MGYIQTMMETPNILETYSLFTTLDTLLTQGQIDEDMHELLYDQAWALADGTESGARRKINARIWYEQRLAETKGVSA